MGKLKIVLIIGLVGILVLTSQLFIPKKYEVAAFKKQKGIQYWTLNTGSKIGFTKIEGSTIQKKNPIIYLHGGPGGRFTNQVVKILKPLSGLGHDLYFYDQIGSGHSERLDTISKYTVRRHQQDLKEIIQKTGFKKVILIGHSWGACLAVNYLQDYSETVEKIILVGPGPILPINWQLSNEASPDSLALKLPAFSNKEGNEKAYNLRSKLILKWAYIFNKKLAADQEVDDFFTFLNQELSKSTHCELKDDDQPFEGGGGYYSHIMTVKNLPEVEDGRNKLQQLKTPLLLLRGQCDNQKWGFANEYLSLFSNSNLEIIDHAGHDLISEHQEQYYDLILKFLNQK